MMFLKWKTHGIHFLILHTAAGEFISNVFISNATEQLTCEKC